MPPGLNFRHPQQNEDNELDIARKTVLEKLDIILSKDDPILKLLNNSIVLQERVELRQRRMLDEFKTKQLQALTQQLSLIDTHTVEAANEVFKKLDAQIEKSVSASLPAYRESLKSVSKDFRDEVSGVLKVQRSLGSKMDKIISLLWICIALLASLIGISFVVLFLWLRL